MYFIVLVNLFLLSCPKNHSKKLWYIEAAVFKQNLRFQPAPVYRLPVMGAVWPKVTCSVTCVTPYLLPLMEGNNLSYASSEDTYMYNDTIMDIVMDLNPPRSEELAAPSMFF